MNVPDAFEVASPHIEVFVLEWYDILESIRMHKWMCTLLGTMRIELFLEQGIDSGVEVEWKSRWTTDTKSTVEIEAQRTIEEKIDFGTTDLEWFGARGIEEIACTLCCVEVGHIVKSTALSPFLAIELFSLLRDCIRQSSRHCE